MNAKTNEHKQKEDNMESLAEQQDADPLDTLLDRLNNLHNITSIEELHELREMARKLEQPLLCKMQFLEEVSLQVDFPEEQARAEQELAEMSEKMEMFWEKLDEIQLREKEIKEGT